MTKKEIDAEIEPKTLLEWGEGLFWGTSTHEADLQRSLRCIGRAADLGDDEAKVFLADRYTALFDRDLPSETVLPWLEKASGMGSVTAKVSLARYRLKEGDAENAIRLFEEAVEEGSADAAFRLGMLWLDGDLVEKNPEKAEFYLNKAAEGGDTLAMCNLGVAYEFGDGLPKDEKKAAEMYRMAVDHGSKRALTMLGNCYREGIGVEPDMDKAVELYQRAVDPRQKGEVDPWSEYIIGLCYRDGRGVEKDEAKALEWFIKAARDGEGSVPAMVSAGLAFMRGIGVEKNYKAAFEWLKKAADRKDPRALYHLGCMYERGRYVDMDKDKAVEYLTRASEGGYPSAPGHLAQFTDDPEEVFALVSEGASRGDSRAQCRLGMLYLKGSEAVDPDGDQAYAWIAKAAAAGNARAKCLLAREFYAKGLIVPQDDKEAFRLYAESAEDRYPLAEYELASCYEAGRGTPKDLKASYQWFKRAAEDGVDRAYPMLMRLAENEDLCEEGESVLSWACLGIVHAPKMIDYFMGYVTEVVKKDASQASKVADALSVAAEKGSVKAKMQLAELYLDRRVSSDPQKASRLFDEVAEAGFADAQYQVALYHLQRHWPLHKYLKPYDPVQAAHWLQKAADQGNSLAQYRLGMLYLKGLGVKKDFDKAKELFTAAQKDGLREAELQLAEIYRKKHAGDLVAFYRKMDAPKLVNFALSGVPEACRELSDRYRNGIGDFPADSVLADYWQGQASLKKRPWMDNLYKLEEPQRWLWQK